MAVKRTTTKAKVIRSADGIERVAQACDRCRSKKTKCDGKRPQCSQCAAVGFECKISDRLSRRAFPRGYTESLEERVRELEAETRKLKALIDLKDEQLELFSRPSRENLVNGTVLGGGGPAPDATGPSDSSFSLMKPSSDGVALANGSLSSQGMPVPSVTGASSQSNNSTDNNNNNNNNNKTINSKDVRSGFTIGNIDTHMGSKSTSSAAITDKSILELSAANKLNSSNLSLLNQLNGPKIHTHEPHGEGCNCGCVSYPHSVHARPTSIAASVNIDAVTDDDFDDDDNASLLSLESNYIDNSSMANGSHSLGNGKSHYNFFDDSKRQFDNLRNNNINVASNSSNGPGINHAHNNHNNSNNSSNGNSNNGNSNNGNSSSSNNNTNGNNNNNTNNGNTNTTITTTTTTNNTINNTANNNGNLMNSYCNDFNISFEQKEAPGAAAAMAIASMKNDKNHIKNQIAALVAMSTPRTTEEILFIPSLIGKVGNVHGFTAKPSVLTAKTLALLKVPFVTKNSEFLVNEDNIINLKNINFNRISKAESHLFFTNLKLPSRLDLDQLITFYFQEWSAFAPVVDQQEFLKNYIKLTKSAEHKFNDNNMFQDEKFGAIVLLIVTLAMLGKKKSSKYKTENGSPIISNTTNNTYSSDAHGNNNENNNNNGNRTKFIHTGLKGMSVDEWSSTAGVNTSNNSNGGDIFGNSASASFDTGSFVRDEGDAQLTKLLNYYHNLIKQLIASSIIDTCSMQSLQILTLALIYSLNVSDAEMSYVLRGKVVSMAQQLRLHRCPSAVLSNSGSIVSKVQQSERRILFWCIYQLDVFSSLQLGVPRLVKDYEIECALPFANDDLDDSNNTNILIINNAKLKLVGKVSNLSLAVMRFSKILGNILDSIFRRGGITTDALGKSCIILENLLENWRKDLPGNLKFELDVNGQLKNHEYKTYSNKILILISLYYQAKMLIYLPVLATELYSSRGSSSYITIHQSASTILSITNFISHVNYFMPIAINPSRMRVRYGLLGAKGALEYARGGNLFQDLKNTLIELINDLKTETNMEVPGCLSLACIKTFEDTIQAILAPPKISGNGLLNNVGAKSMHRRRSSTLKSNTTGGSNLKNNITASPTVSSSHRFVKIEPNLTGSSLASINNNQNNTIGNSSSNNSNNHNSLNGGVPMQHQDSSSSVISANRCMPSINNVAGNPRQASISPPSSMNNVPIAPRPHSGDSQNKIHSTENFVQQKQPFNDQQQPSQQRQPNTFAHPQQQKLSNIAASYQNPTVGVSGVGIGSNENNNSNNSNNSNNGSNSSGGMNIISTKNIAPNRESPPDANFDLDGNMFSEFAADGSLGLAQLLDIDLNFHNNAQLSDFILNNNFNNNINISSQPMGRSASGSAGGTGNLSTSAIDSQGTYNHTNSVNNANNIDSQILGGSGPVVGFGIGDQSSANVNMINSNEATSFAVTGNGNDDSHVNSNGNDNGNGSRNGSINNNASETSHIPTDSFMKFESSLFDWQK